jgi:type VI secretion system protein ImpJ
MFLQPQHFQQQDCYHEARLRRYLHWLSPFCWGVKTLAINETALRNFIFEIERCEFITWEGTLVCFQGEALPSNARILPRPCEPLLDPAGGPVGVYLGVKRLQWEEANASLRPELDHREAAADGQPRFSIQERDTPDFFMPSGQSATLQYLLHEVRLLFDHDAAVQSEAYELVKIAEVLRAAQGQGAVLSRRYVPPSVSIHASPMLAGMLREMRDLLTAKGREFTDYKRQYRVQNMEMGGRETAYLVIMQMLNRYIPLFHHHLEVQETHPVVLYALLRQLVGELSTFSETISVLGGPLPPYRHDQIWECFNAALEMAKDLLNELTKGPEYVVPLVYDGEYFAANLERRFFEGNNRYYLVIKADIPPRELERLLTGTGKVCSREEMEALRQRALPGLPVRYLETPPTELPRRAQSSYFELDHRTNLWNRIEQRQNIAVFCQLSPDKTEMQLMVLFES